MSFFDLRILITSLLYLQTLLVHDGDVGISKGRRNKGIGISVVKQSTIITGIFVCINFRG